MPVLASEYFKQVRTPVVLTVQVQSQRLSMDLPTSGSRHWQEQHRWSPYGSRFNLPFPLQPQYAFQQTSVPYTSWQPEIAYGGMSQGMGMPYARPSYSPTYTMYAPEAVDSHVGHPPSFMLPDMNQSAYANTATMHNLGRQQTAMWLDQINSVSLPNQTAHVAPTVYPLTPVESARPYTGLLGMPPTSLSPDRILPQPAVARPFLHTYSTRHDAEPLSAVSHRSSIGWTADTPSNVSYASSRTSCGDVYDITPVSSSVDCSGQTLTYAYDVTSASPHVEVPVLALPFTLDTAPQQTISDIRSQPMTNTEQALADTVSASVRTPRDMFPESHGRGKATKRNANSKLYRNILTQEREASCSWREPSSRTERDVPINDEAYPALGIALSASAT